jgi:hypothetical protein
MFDFGCRISLPGTRGLHGRRYNFEEAIAFKRFYLFR